MASHGGYDVRAPQHQTESDNYVNVSLKVDVFLCIALLSSYWKVPRSGWWGVVVRVAPSREESVAWLGD